MEPMPQPSLGGSRYILVSTDDYSQKSWIYFLQHKSEAFMKFRTFKQQVELEIGNKIRFFRSNRGGEYLSNGFISFCSNNGIMRELTQAHTPQQNGVSKRHNRMIMERARSMSHDCQLPIFLWTEAIAMATYLINRSPTKANLGKIPETKYRGIQPDISNLRIFGCLAYVHIPKEHRNKLDSKTQRCLFLGFGSETKAYRLYDQIRRKIIISRDVVFDESKVGYQYIRDSNSNKDGIQFSISDTQNSDPLDFPTPELATGHDILNTHDPLETEQPNFSTEPTYHEPDPSLNHTMSPSSTSSSPGRS